MSIFAIKPVEKSGQTFVGPVITYEDSSGWNNTNHSLHFLTTSSSQSNYRTDIPHAGFTTDNISNASWEGSSTGIGFIVYQISAIGSNTSPTISEVNQTNFITEYLHSSHSNSLNGLGYTTNGNGGTWDTSSYTFTSSGEVISFNGWSYATTTWSPVATDTIRIQDNDNGNVYVNSILVGSQTGGGSGENLAWYQDEASTNYFDDISESNFFNNHTDVTNKRKNHRRAMTSLAESTSTDAIEKFTKLMNLKLLDRIIDADDYREAERFALSRLTDSEQTEIKNIIRYS